MSGPSELAVNIRTVLKSRRGDEQNGAPTVTQNKDGKSLTSEHKMCTYFAFSAVYSAFLFDDVFVQLTLCLSS